MSTNTTPPPRPPSARPKGLQALKGFLLGYLLLGAPIGTPTPRPALVYPWSIRHLFVDEGYVATVLCNAMPGLLEKITVQRKRRKAACGGWKHPNRFTKADLVQAPADLVLLAGMSSAELCDLLFLELRLLIRLTRESQRFSWKPEKRWWLRETWEENWKARHGALVSVLERIVHLSARLRKRVNANYAEQCVRWQLRRVWADLLGPNVPLNSSVSTWLLPLKLEAKVERHIAWRLKREQAQGHSIPEFFAPLLEEEASA